MKSSRYFNTAVCWHVTHHTAQWRHGLHYLSCICFKQSFSWLGEAIDVFLFFYHWEYPFSGSIVQPETVGLNKTKQASDPTLQSSIMMPLYSALQLETSGPPRSGSDGHDDPLFLSVTCGGLHLIYTTNWLLLVDSGSPRVQYCVQVTFPGRSL